VDNGWDLFKKKLAVRFRGISVTVGIQGSEAAEQHDVEAGGTLTNVQLGSHHEFGATVKNGFGKGIKIVIPQRSFLRSTFDENRKKYRKLLIDAAKKSVRAVSPLAAFVVAGEIARGDVIKKIRAGIPPPLEPTTIARKGSSTPLIDTGILLNSITAKVRG
jgi:phage gpG-like protein